MQKIKFNLLEARTECAKQLQYTMEETNKLWHSLIRLVITLSSSFLLITLALVDKLFPKTDQFTGFSTYLIASWVFLFISVISGIIAEIDNTIFFGNCGADLDRTMREIDIKIANDLEEDVIERPDAYIINAPITWGVISINSFIFAIYCMCLTFLEKPFSLTSLTSKAILFPVGILSLIGLSFYLIKKRK